LTIFGILNNSQQNKQNLLLFIFLKKKNKNRQHGPLPSLLPSLGPTRRARVAHAHPRSSLSPSAYLSPPGPVRPGRPTRARTLSLSLPMLGPWHRGGHRRPTRRRRVSSEAEPHQQHHLDPANTTTPRKGYNMARRGFDRGHGGHGGDPPGGTETKTRLRRGSN
jgi:hypothetical protein